MIILDKPYVSDLLKNTLAKNRYSVLQNETIKSYFNFDAKDLFISSEQAAIEYNAKIHPKIYTNSENAIGWISKHLTNTELPEKINLFKNKVKFRELVKDLYPDFYFKEVPFHQLEEIKIKNTPKPFVIKPSVGFFSMGVYKVDTNEDWPEVVKQIHQEMEEVKTLYPQAVMDSSSFIIEQNIEGDEFAFDVYFNENSEPVILGIFKHIFASGDDVSDRVYYTSEHVIKDNLTDFAAFIKEIGQRAQLTNFPMHVEVRKNDKGRIQPIEINPMRFGGWCTTADLTTFAFDLNPYEYYFNGENPNWKKLLQDKKDKHYCMIILDNTTGFDANDIVAFDYEKLLSRFKLPLDLRKTNWREYPVFGILFTETHVNNYQEIENILTSDLKEFVTLAP